jgi:hypothetical protein
LASGPAKRIGRKAGAGKGERGNAGNSANAGKGENAANGDKMIEVIHELRPADSPRPGAHSKDGSPIESDVGLDRKRKDPSAP